MSRRNCSVFGCNNTYENCKGKNPPVKFYSFPGMKMKRWHDLERKQKWIKFAARKK